MTKEEEDEALTFNPYDFEEDDNREPDVYACYGCGTTASKDPGGWGCPKCGAIMEPEYF